MNASEFERNKPRETYKAIQDLKKYLLMLNENGETKVNVSNVLEDLNDIEEKFLRGE